MLTLAGLTLSGLAVETPAAADDATVQASTEAEAQAAMERGIAAFGKGDAATALFEYERAMRLVPRANLPYRYAAEALLQLERPRAAIEHLEKYLAMNPQVSDASTVRARIDSLRRERLPSLLRLRAPDPGSQVRVDRGALQTLPLDVELTPGEHTLTVEHAGRLPTTERIHVVGGRTEERVLAIGAPVPEKDPTPEPASSALLVGSFVTLGAGLLTLGTSAVLDATLLEAKISDLAAASKRGEPNLLALKNDATSARTGVVAGYVAGSILTVAGGVLMLVWQYSRPKTATKVGASGSVARLSFSF